MADNCKASYSLYKVRTLEGCKRFAADVINDQPDHSTLVTEKGVLVYRQDRLIAVVARDSKDGKDY